MGFRNVAILGMLLAGLAGCAGREERSNLLELFAVDPSNADRFERDLDNTYDAMTLLRWAEASHVKGEYAVAASEYLRFLELYPAHVMSAFARYRLALSYDRQIDKPNRDPAPTQKAQAAFQEVIQRDPDGPYTAEARQRLAELAHRQAKQSFHIGMFYYKKAAWRAAIVRFIQTIPDADASLTAQSFYLLGESYEKAGYPKEAAEVRGRLQTEYPDSDFARKLPPLPTQNPNPPSSDVRPAPTPEATQSATP
jgi:outer membrane protein assembly factor BamD